jgi:hypothetical protein
LFRIFLFLTYLAVVSASLADPSPFGLELGKTTVSEAQAQYEMTASGINKYSGGPMFDVPTGQIEFDDLLDLTVIFDANDRLVGVMTTLPKGRFGTLHQTLAGKYRLVSENIPFVGNSSAKYIDGETEITLSAPHLSFELTMNYLRKELVDAFAEQSAAEAREKRRAEESQL